MASQHPFAKVEVYVVRVVALLLLSNTAFRIAVHEIAVTASMPEVAAIVSMFGNVARVTASFCIGVAGGVVGYRNATKHWRSRQHP